MNCHHFKILILRMQFVYFGFVDIAANLSQYDLVCEKNSTMIKFTSVEI